MPTGTRSACGCSAVELDEPDVRGMPFAEEVLFAVFHASDTPTTFVLPPCSPDAHWVLLLDTAASPQPRRWRRRTGIYPELSACTLQGRSVVLLRQERQSYGRAERDVSRPRPAATALLRLSIPMTRRPGSAKDPLWYRTP